MKKVNKRVQKIKQQKATKRNARSKTRESVKEQRLNAKANKLDALKKDLQAKWLELVNKQFQESANR